LSGDSSADLNLSREWEFPCFRRESPRKGLDFQFATYREFGYSFLSQPMSTEAKKKKIDYERERREILSRKFEELGQILVAMGLDKREVSTQVDTLSSAIQALRELKEKREFELEMPPSKRVRSR